MKRFTATALIVCTLMISGCGDSDSIKETSSGDSTDSDSSSTAGQAGEKGGIVGEWEQQFSCFDKNGNYLLDADERKPAETPIGFDWFRFNADGTCLRDKDMKFEGTWSINESTSKKKVMIQGGDSLSYTIEELTETELVLGASGAFMVLKRVE